MTAENFPAQQMCCLLVNWSTGRFEYIFLKCYQFHKDCGAAWVASSAPARAPWPLRWWPSPAPSSFFKRWKSFRQICIVKDARQSVQTCLSWEATLDSSNAHCSTCKSMKSIRDNTVLSNSNLQLKRFVGLLWSFSEDRGRNYKEIINGACMPISGDYKDTLMSSKTVTKFFN